MFREVIWDELPELWHDDALRLRSVHMLMSVRLNQQYLTSKHKFLSVQKAAFVKDMNRCTVADEGRFP